MENQELAFGSGEAKFGEVYHDRQSLICKGKMKTVEGKILYKSKLEEANHVV